LAWSKKTAWLPCCICGDPSGDILGSKETPTRTSMARFGVEGDACHKCYNRVLSRVKDGLPPNPMVLRLGTRRKLIAKGPDA
jgi:hypothetical protein